ncbi:Gfo/Idh/MocA family protein [Scopulibacillus cellulosilyticus]|uniref:Gfo/Idh/MocA family protein n=1 Tax=Scopulibacillus cellulosilyticus TaxID=2665665 RepID=A0ABW2PUW7_9BACL
MKKLSAVLLGAGDRGAHAYGPYAISYPNELEFVAVADPNEERSYTFAQTHQIDKNNVYDSWTEVLDRPKLADIMVICTLDRMHFKPTIRALEKGYHVLLEKPMSPHPDECIKMAQAAEQNNRLLSIGHVLRYTPFWSSMKRVIDEGKIGEIVSIQLNENVGYLHMAHSFVRGNWNNSDVTSPMILQKSCHDMDILSWLIGKPCLRVSSFGSLKHFRKENAPEGSAPFCLDGCEVYNECPFYAPRFYLGEGKGWARKITDDTSREGIIEALRTGPYGKCVYQSDNNVVDHQVVNLDFQGGATATFSMCGFTHNITRNIQVMGTKGEIRGYMETNSFTIYDFLTKEENEIRVHRPTSGHGGGDTELMRNFLHEVRHFQGHQGLTSAHTSTESHMMAFAAEKSRLDEGKPINLLDYKEQLVQSL